MMRIRKKVDVNEQQIDNLAAVITSFIGTRVHRNGSNQSINSSVNQLITWTAETHDTNGMFSPPDSKVYVKTAGYYRCDLHVHVADMSDRKFVISRIYKNGTQVATDEQTTSNAGSNSECSSCWTIRYCNENDYFEGYVQHNHGSARDLSGNERLSWMDVYKLGN